MRMARIDDCQGKGMPVVRVERFRQGRTRSWTLVLVPFLLSACAKVGDPLPPLVTIPDPVRVQLVQQARDRIEIWIPPPLDDIKAVEIYRECGTALPEGFAGGSLSNIKIVDIPRNRQTGIYVVRDPEPIFSEPCRYQVQVENQQGRLSVPSNTVGTSLVPPPGPPTNLGLEVQEDQIVVSWNPPAQNPGATEPSKVLGYLVNASHVVSGTEFFDKEIVFGEKVSYFVQSIGNLEDPSVLSRPSQQLEIVPQDRFAPPVPENLTAVSLDSKVQLLWDAVTSSDLAGYFVFRGLEGKGLEKLSSLVNINRYVDAQPLMGAKAYYAVKAVDNSGNESLPSEPVSVTVGR